MDHNKQSPKLLRAMAAIKEILEEENIAGVIVLHTPGYVQTGIKIDPSYSCCSIKDGKYKINALLREDFGGNKEAMVQRVGDTADMLNGLVTNAARCILPLGDITRIMNKSTDAANPENN